MELRTESDRKVDLFCILTKIFRNFSLFSDNYKEFLGSVSKYPVLWIVLKGV